MSARTRQLPPPGTKRLTVLTARRTCSGRTAVARTRWRTRPSRRPRRRQSVNGRTRAAERTAITVAPAAARRHSCHDLISAADPTAVVSPATGGPQAVHIVRFAGLEDARWCTAQAIPSRHHRMIPAPPLPSAHASVKRRDAVRAIQDDGRLIPMDGENRPMHNRRSRRPACMRRRANSTELHRGVIVSTGKVPIFGIT